MEVIPTGEVGSQEDIHGAKGARGALSKEDCRAAVKSIFMGTSCYDLIAQSSKTIVFETTIPFQMAFYALIEHDTAVAPLWDPGTHSFTGLMTIADYVRALKLCRQENVSMLELSARSIADLIGSPKFRFQHGEFSSVDAEDSVQNMCYFLNRHNTNFVPILNPDDGTLVSILGYLDLIHLLHQAAKQHPELFATTIQDMRLDVTGNGKSRAAALPTTPILSILQHDDDLQGGVAIVDERNIVTGIYHMTDVTFITRALESQNVLTNLETFTIDDVLKSQIQQQQAGESGSLTPPLVTCTVRDRIDDLLSVMMQARSSIAVVVDDHKGYMGIVSIEDIVKFYLE